MPALTQLRWSRAAPLLIAAALAIGACSGGGDSIEAYCDEASFLEQGFEAALADVFAADETTSVVAAVAVARERFESMAGRAPDNIKGDVDFVREVFVDIDEAFDEADSEDPDELLKAATGVFTDFGEDSRAARLDRAGQTLLDHYDRSCS